jgi:hypothetical protein
MGRLTPFAHRFDDYPDVDDSSDDDADGKEDKQRPYDSLSSSSAPYRAANKKGE